MSHKEEKKLKKLHQILKNRRTQQINLQEETLARGRDLEKEREEKLKESARASSSRAARKDGEPVWSARMQEIRNRIDGKKRMADERWNRFAGTGESGGRGL
jgi:hypothetical protein